MELNNFYLYKAFVTDVYDGDTITVDIDLGFWTTLHKQKIRLYGINTPELKGETRKSGLAAKSWLASMIMGKSIILESIKDRSEKYGRILGTVYLETTTLNEGIKTVTYVNINQKMVESGLAESYLI